MSGVRDFLLLQINDALFPIGGYSHSYGLETYIQKGIVWDADTAEKYIRQNIRTNLLYNELLLIRLAWEYASEDNLEAILELEEIAEASRSQKEIREASRKLGSRFFKNHNRTGYRVCKRHLFAVCRGGRGTCLPSLRIWSILFCGRDRKGTGGIPFSLFTNIGYGYQLCKDHTFKPEYRTETAEPHDRHI